MKIRRGSLSDLASLLNIENICFKDTEDNEDVEELKLFLESGKYTTFIAVEKDTVIGYVTVEDTKKSKKSYHVTSVAIIPEYRKRGIAGDLLDTCYSNMPLGYFMSCEIRSSNFSSQKLFEKHGFKKIKNLDNFYPDEMGYYYETEKK